MDKVKLAAVLAIAFLSIAAKAPKPPAVEWRDEIVEANQAWAKIPHAILKIQDAAYLGEGQTATLVGVKGKPASYHWVQGKSGKGILLASYQGGHMHVVMGAKTFDETTIGKSISIDTDVDIAGFPTQVGAGVMGARIMLYNQLRADALNFKGVAYFPYDPSYRVTATFKPDLKFPPRVFRTSRGTDKQFFHVGDATFTLGGKAFTLPFYSGDNDAKTVKDMSSFFMDDLTGKGTYGAGRYVDISNFGAFPPKTAIIDFNFAYNPNCARSAFYTCPVATDVIAMAVRAGERDPHAAH
ncbi:MAG: DUF1684 domain-containing protein [Rhizomicrobium sp.]